MQDNPQPTQAPSSAAKSPVPAPEKPPATDPSPPPPLTVKKQRHTWRWIIGTLAALLVAALVAVGGAWYWYQQQLTSPNPQSQEAVRFNVKSGYTGTDVAAGLAEAGLIKNQRAFEIYYRFNHQAGLKAGVYLLSKDMSVEEIVTHLEKGKPDEFALTFLPGGTVSDAKKVLTDAGYAVTDVDAAFRKTYDHPLFTDKPVDIGLEGYIYGDTYNFYTGAKVEEVLNILFDHMYQAITTNKLIDAYKAQGMNLYQGITLASIIQKEVAHPDDMAIVSQIFHKRLREDVSLGADATFVYAARQMGVAPDVGLDSPYNTRIHKGLPPTPISSPGKTALIAAGNPADTDYLYFVSGDDGKNYYSKTNEEHERLTREHCIQNCILPQQ